MPRIAGLIVNEEETVYHVMAQGGNRKGPLP